MATSSTAGIFSSLEDALAQVTEKADARRSAQAAFEAAVKEHEFALKAAQAIYAKLQDALSFVVQAPQNFRP